MSSLLGWFFSFTAQAGGSDHSNHHGNHGSHFNSGDKHSSPSTMLMGKATFVIGGVDGVASKEEMTFNYDMKLMGMTSLTGKDMLMTAIRTGNFTKMDPFGMMGAARLDTSFFKSSDNFSVDNIISFTFSSFFRVT